METVNYTPQTNFTLQNVSVYANTLAKTTKSIVNIELFNRTIQILPTQTPLSVAKEIISILEMEIANLQASKEGKIFVERYRIAEKIDLIREFIKI